MTVKYHAKDYIKKDCLLIKIKCLAIIKFKLLVYPTLFSTMLLHKYENVNKLRIIQR